MRLHTRQSRFMHYNAGAFVSEGVACLVDPGILPEEIEALHVELGGAEIRFIVLTHADWDHVLGPDHLPRATIVTHSAYEEGLDPEGIRVALAQLENHAGVTRAQPFEPPLPDETFDTETVLRVGDLELRLEHAPGHSANMLTIYEPESSTLWASDVLSDVELPSVVDDLGMHQRTLDRLSELEIRTLVPGHGSPTDAPTRIRRRLDEDRTYLAELRRSVEEAVAAGMTLDETVTASADVSLRRSEGDEAIHRLNVEKTYADLGGDADSEQVGYARAWKETTRA